MHPGPHPRILVIDDDLLIHESVRLFLNDEFEILGFTSGEEALAAAEKELFPVVILDLRMNGIYGIDVLRRLKAMCPHQQIIICTGHASRDSAVQAVNLDAYRYLLKPLQLDIFRKTVYDAFLQFDRSQILQMRSSTTVNFYLSVGLNMREAEVAVEIFHGKSNREIAQVLGISQRTVEKHVERILAHFQIAKRSSLAPKIRSLGLN